MIKVGSQNIVPRWNVSLGFGIAIGVALLATVIVASVYLRINEWKGAPGFISIFAWQALAWSPWVFIAPLIFSITKKYPITKNALAKRFTLYAFISIVFSLLMTGWFAGMSVLISPFSSMEDTKYGVFQFFFVFWFQIVFLMHWFLIGVAHARQFRDQVREQERKAAELKINLVEAQLRALKLQIQPHFLFNTLNALVVALRRENIDRALKITLSLSEMLRIILSADETDEVPLEKELSLLDKYLELEAYRYGEQLKISKTVAPETLNILVPSLILQPIVENAIRHEMAATAFPSVINISITRNQAALIIEVANNAPPGSNVNKPQSGFGIALKNIRRRLQELYGDAHELVLNKEETLTTVRVKIPARMPVCEVS
ncbi:MAG: histidine kinase [Gammaproteobacteria bacterium]|nr:histidine kinase [Gammaproteobacteria bacterium]